MDFSKFNFEQLTSIATLVIAICAFFFAYRNDMDQ